MKKILHNANVDSSSYRKKNTILLALLFSFLLCLIIQAAADTLNNSTSGLKTGTAEITGTAADTPAAFSNTPQNETPGVTGTETRGKIPRDRTARIRNITTYQMIFTTLPLAFGLLHLILFFFFKRAKENLYFAIYLFFYSASIFFDYQSSLVLDVEPKFIYLQIHRAVQPFFVLTALRFVYSLFDTGVPRRFYLFAVLLFIPAIYAVFNPVYGYDYFSAASVLVTVEIWLTIIPAVKRKKEGAWIIALGFFIYQFFSLFDTLMDLKIGLKVPFTEMENPYAFGTIGFLVTMSVYLARNYAGTYERLLTQERLTREQEVERRLLEADNARKTKELEDARRLQLSMLPQCLNDFPGMDACFFMEPAAEVGGDYYDYRFDEDGSLVFAVGDATGHGLKAGIMVATVKGLFHAIGSEPDIPAFFNRCTATIKQMGMGNLFMAMTTARIKDNRLTLSAAGMPPLLIFRAAEKKVEELLIKGPPLGGFSRFSYRQVETKLLPGDVLLFMSDGFPELFNEKEEMLGYERGRSIFKKAAEEASGAGSATDILNRLCEAAIQWRGGRAQEDDITFAVFKTTKD